MNSVVVTGASGFLGRALVQELSQNNAKVFAVVRDKTSNIDGIQDLPGVEIFYSQLDDLKEIPSVIQPPIDVFYHLAWAGCSGNAREDYRLQLKNVTWTLDAVDTAHKLGCKRFVGIGSSAESDVDAYAKSAQAIPNRASHYGTAKIAAHYMSKAECTNKHIEHIWARLANVYGPGDHSSNFINSAIKTMLTGQPASFTAGEQYYDFVYIQDAAQGLFRLGNNGKENSAYFVGSGQPAPLKEFIRIIRDEINPAITLNLGTIPFHGISLSKESFDSTLCMKETGYAPKTSFDIGIKHTIEWIKSQDKNMYMEDV